MGVLHWLPKCQLLHTEASAKSDSVVAVVCCRHFPSNSAKNRNQKKVIIDHEPAFRAR